MKRALSCWPPLVLAGPAVAHHGWGSYDAAKPVTVTGPILTSKYENPHATLTVKGSDKEWTVTLAPTSRMGNRGREPSRWSRSARPSRPTAIRRPWRRTRCAPSASRSTARPTRCADADAAPGDLRRAGRLRRSAQAIRQSTWIYMAANVGHIVSLMVFAGAVAVMDLRMAGAFAATCARLVCCSRARRVAILAFLGLVAHAARCCSPPKRATSS